MWCWLLHWRLGVEKVLPKNRKGFRTIFRKAGYQVFLMSVVLAVDAVNVAIPLVFDCQYPSPGESIQYLVGQGREFGKQQSEDSKLCHP